VTARREVPFTGDSLGWVHSEIADLKSRLSLAQQATEQGRVLAADAADKANALRGRIDQVEAQYPALAYLQDELRLVREQLNRIHDDVNSLRQSREETERRMLADAERARLDKNDTIKYLGDIQRQIDAWQERVSGFEEHNRRNVEVLAQTQMHVESLQTDQEAADARQGRFQTTHSRLDQDVSRLSAAIPDLQREDDTHKERTNSLNEMVHRLEDQIDGLRSQMGRIDRIDDRLELVQAERSRHGERLTELTLDLDTMKAALTDQAERLSLVEVRIQNFHDDVRALDERLLSFRDELVLHMRAVTEMQADFRKRQIAAMEKEIRDLRSKGLSFGEE
jgi:chromosome segregation ATPase